MSWRKMLAAAVAVGSTLVAAPAAMAVVPVVSVMPPLAEPENATLIGRVDPSALRTTYHFEWGVDGSDFCDNSPRPRTRRSSRAARVEAFDGTHRRVAQHRRA